MERLRAQIWQDRTALTLAAGLLLAPVADAPARDWRPLPGDTTAQAAPPAALTPAPATPSLAWRALPGTPSPAAAPEETTQGPAARTVTVRPGDTLGAIARREGLSV